MSAVLDMAREFYAVSGYAEHIPFDADTCYNQLEVAMEQGMCFVADKGHELAGFIMGLAVPAMMNRNYLMGVELAWWVKPAYRNSPLSVKLLKSLESAAKSRGVVLWSMVCLDTQSPEKVGGMYERLGYHRTETTFSKAL